MNLLKELSQTEYLYITAFIVFYLGYSIRIFFISKKIKIGIPRLFLKFMLRSAYFTLFIIALLGPSFGDIKKEIKAIGKDVYIAIDLSNSMDANDISPTRLEKIKFELSKGLKFLNSDRVGLIVFSEDAFVQCPLTYDHNTVKLFLETLSTKLLSSGGTVMNAPLTLAYSKFASNISSTTDQAKVLILVTDGEEFSNSSYIETIKKIKKAGIKLVILGIGTEKGGRIVIDNSFKRNNLGEYIISKLNAIKLKEISELADGKYFEITHETNEIKSMFVHISKLEGTFKGSKKIESVANKYFYFLFIALVLVIIDVLVTVKTIKI